MWEIKKVDISHGSGNCQCCGKKLSGRAKRVKHDHLSTAQACLTPRCQKAWASRYLKAKG